MEELTLSISNQASDEFQYSSWPLKLKWGWRWGRQPAKLCHFLNLFHSDLKEREKSFQLLTEIGFLRQRGTTKAFK